MYTTLITELSDGIFIITINRPDKLNALNKIVIEELALAIGEIYSHVEIKSAIIIGAGDKAFVAGADISEFLLLDAEAGKVLAQKGQDIVFSKIANCPKLIVAAVNGYALGGGCELAMACHFRLCSETAKFGQPEINLGLIPGYGGTQRLTTLIGSGRAIELLLTGNMIDANAALQYGLVNYVVPQHELLNKAKLIVQTINSKSPLATSAILKTVNAVFDKTKNGFEIEVNEFGKCFGTEDMKEGVTAFLEKRKPHFNGK